jgi:hypothetical protein
LKVEGLKDESLKLEGFNFQLANFPTFNCLLCCTAQAQTKATQLSSQTGIDKLRTYFNDDTTN